MTCEPHNDEVVVRPTVLNRAAGWAMIAFVLLFGSAGLVPDQSTTPDPGAGTMMVLFAALIGSIGIALISAKATATPAGIRYRYGVVRRRIRARDVEGICVGRASGMYYPRICLHVQVRDRARPIRLSGLQRADTSKAREALNQAAADMRVALGRDDVASPPHPFSPTSALSGAPAHTPRVGPTETIRDEDVRALVRALLDQGDFPGRPELLDQVQGLEYVDGPVDWLRLRVDPRCPRSTAASPVPNGPTVLDEDGKPFGGLLLWLDDEGYIEYLEYHWFGSDAPTRLPTPNQLVEGPRQTP